ncbi:MAG: trigger factor [Geminocystis sp.]|nr:trigger factor [Geminocystis sp.]HIK37209.1 trigger factor [Geminocystis sp. M7585_C2015_104]MCS7147124.1 trigger factor [Geminocystis sp.]MCX8079127.1 trigger factor [Geminocystis sp.]MDW8116760.1 trigger factor [Geminocystis sp.]
MKVTQEKLPASQIGLEIEIPAEITKFTYEKVITEIAQNTSIPGFRKGKAPRAVVLQRIGVDRIKAAVVDELISDSLKKAIEQESIPAIGNYQLRSNFEELVQQFDPEKPFVYRAAVDVPPEVNLGQYTGLHIKAEEVKYNPEDVDKLLRENQEKMATFVPVENRPAQMGDIVVIDFEGRKKAADNGEGEILPNFTAKEYQLELREGKFIPGFVEGIVGMNLEETKKLHLSLPEDYPQKDLAGKEVVVTVTLKEIKEKELPPLDDEFAKEISEFQTMAQLRESLEKQFREKAENETKYNIHNAIVEELLKHTQIDLPKTMIEEEVQSILLRTASQVQSYGLDVKRFFTKEMIARMRENAKPEASRNLHAHIILQKIAEKEGITVSEEEIKARCEEIRQELKDDVDETKLEQYVKSELTAEKTLQWLETHNQIELVPQGSLSKENSQPQSESQSQPNPETEG